MGYLIDRLFWCIVVFGLLFWVIYGVDVALKFLVVAYSAFVVCVIILYLGAHYGRILK